ncbi:hypothetical protein [Nonomuraea zeae]|uniref:hypothetical protein n=1 Tax=Nonomuraea zeae TaxID=1642303 RepID=UPI0014797DF2|nr:hypothetical protein [Nonomuraea zeae]
MKNIRTQALVVLVAAGVIFGAEAALATTGATATTSIASCGFDWGIPCVTDDGFDWG